MQTPIDIIDDLTGMAHAIAADLLADREFYLLAESWLPQATGCLGWTCPDGVPADIRFRLEERGQYRGQGVVVVLQPEALESVDVARRIVCHELAHNPIRPLPTEPEQTATDRLVEVLQYSIAAEAWAKDPAAFEPSLPWADAGDHGAKHIRRCVHLHRRAVQAGYPFDIRGCFESWFYTQHAAEHFADILRGEVKRMAGCTMAEVEALPFEPEFERRFQSEIAFWKSFNTPKECKPCT